LTVVLFGVYAAATWQHAALWGDGDKLLLVWAQSNPGSARAQVSAAQIWLRNGHPERALAQLDSASKRIPGDVLLISNTLAFRAELGLLSVGDLETGARQIRNGRFDAQAMRALEQLVGIVNARAPRPDYTEVLVSLLQSVREDLAGGMPPVHRMTLYLQGLLLAGQGQPDAAMPYLISALEHYGTVDSGLRMVSDLAILGHYREALELLSHCESLLGTAEDSELIVSRQTHHGDIVQLRTALLDDLEAQNASEHSSAIPPATNGVVAQ
jgi:tetratricopeptide (TPR) repeat protein